MEAVVRDRGAIDQLERETIRRATWRLLPLLMVGMLFAWLDRVNVGMAALTMNRQLGFSNAVFGFGAGLFFLGYLVGEIPSNLVLNVVGARRWIARIMFTWGIVAGLTAFVWNDWSFYGIRVLLGLAEAGFYPGVVLYLTWWFPSYYRSRIMAMFMSAILVCNVVGTPISGLLLQLDGMFGLAGWQLLFLLEAAPTLVLAVLFWQLLTDRPADAAWLRPEQRAWLTERLAAEQASREAVHKFSLAEAFYHPKVWLITVAMFGTATSIYGTLIFLPLIVQGLGVPTGWIGVVAALPYVFALISMNVWGWHSDRNGERPWHFISGMLVCAAGLVACVLIGSAHPVWLMVALTCAMMGLWAAQPAFWAMPSALLTGTAAAGGLAMIISVGNIGGWLGPTVFGLVKDATGSDNVALFCLAAAPVISSIAIFLAGHDRRMELIPPRR